MGYWKCKECGSTKFRKITVETTEEYVTFDKDGLEDDCEEIDYSIENSLICDNCGNSASIFNFISDLAEWEE